MKKPPEEVRGAEALFALFLERYGARGERTREAFDPQAFVAAHPQLAERLRAFQADLEGSFAGGLGRHLSRVGRAPGSTAGSRAAAPDADLTSTILARLVERGPASPRYEARDELAHGGQGRVLRVWDEELGRMLAMKVTHEPHTSTAEKPHAARSIGRFLEEARLTGQLDHPGIVPVHELGVDEEGHVFFTMKLVKGRDLKAIYALVANHEEGWTQTRALSVLLRVCEGMAYAHSKGVIHRDLKPANVMVGRFGEVFVMDWGLARVLDQPDTRDLRIQENLFTTQVRSLRHGSAAGEPDASLITLDGDVVGTPAYMSPEQARGALEAMGPHSDVYSAGSMLYHLFAGHPPYLPPGTRLNNYAIWSRVQEGPPQPLHERAQGVPAELIAITDKAMARDPARRYRDMAELGEDLRAYLEHRVVRAYETGALAELRKWIVRNRGSAAAIGAGLVAALGGLATAGGVEARRRADAERQGAIAQQHAAAAQASAEEARRQAAAASRERANVLRLSAFQDLEDLRERAESLWPATPERIRAFEDWLADAARLIAGLDPDPARGEPGHYAVLADLRLRATPGVPLDGEQARKTPPALTPERLQKEIASLRQALEVRAGRAEPPEFPLDEGSLSVGATELNKRAWGLVEPGRTEHGREAEGMALARLAFERARDEAELADVADTLAWALFANGLEEEALAVSQDAVDAASSERRGEFEEHLERLRRETERRERHGTRALFVLEQRLESLEWERSGQRFAADEDRWWHAQLVKLIREIEAFSDPRTGLVEGFAPPFGLGVQRRLELARALVERTLEGPEARALWAEAAASIADPARCPRYAGLAIGPQLGLLPVGRDPDSGLWEFADPQTGSVPERDPQGRLAFDASSGLVFVLVPGGKFLMGAQVTDRAAPGHDPEAEFDEQPPHEVELGPFFLSKYEMTQAQWSRFTGHNPSYYRIREQTPFHPLLYPVDNVSWEECRRVLGRLGLDLPTEAQWEYATRAGTTTRWWPGDEVRLLKGRANVFDLAEARRRSTVPAVAQPELDDGLSGTAPVHVFQPNPFGLCGLIGNLNEWCLDGYLENAYYQVARSEPVIEPERSGNRVARGGSMDLLPRMARSSARVPQPPNFPIPSIGVRPARRLAR